MSTPFGRPVDPDVYRQYTTCSPPTGTPSALPDSAAASDQSRSMHHASTDDGNTLHAPSSVTTSAAPPSSATPSPAPLLSSWYFTRSGGCFPSTGTYPAPAFTIPSSPTTCLTLRLTQRPTSLSRPAPRARSTRATRFARSSSSPYVNDSVPWRTATAPGCRRASSAIRSCSHSAPRARPTRSARFPPDHAVSSPSRRPPSAVSSPSRCSTCSAIASTRAAPTPACRYRSSSPSPPVVTTSVNA